MPSERGKRAGFLPIDLFDLFSGGSDTIRFGETNLAALGKGFRIAAEADAAGGPCTVARKDGLELVFDDTGALALVRYGFLGGDRVPDAVKAALPGPAGAASDFPLRFRGHGLGDFATLPRFCSLTGRSAAWTLNGRGYDHWVSASAESATARLTFEFILADVPVPFEEYRHFDYCLYGVCAMSVLYERQLNARLNAQPDGENHVP